MTPETIAALLQLGLAGVGLYLFAIGFLRSRKVDDDEHKRQDEHLAKLEALWEALFTAMRDDRNAWRDLALGTERRLDRVVPTVAAAVGAPVPSLPPAPPEAHAGQ